MRAQADRIIQVAQLLIVRQYPHSLFAFSSLYPNLPLAFRACLSPSLAGMQTMSYSHLLGRSHLDLRASSPPPFLPKGKRWHLWPAPSGTGCGIHFQPRPNSKLPDTSPPLLGPIQPGSLPLGTLLHTRIYPSMKKCCINPCWNSTL